MARFLLLAILVSTFAQAQEAHKFWTRRNILSFVATSAIRSLDAANTCHNLSRGLREQWIPSQSCAGVVSYMGGSQALQMATQYILHRRGHHRLESLAPLSVGANIAGMVMSDWDWSTPHSPVMRAPRMPLHRR